MFDPQDKPVYQDLILRGISEARLSPYRQQGDADEARPLARYFWNIALCEALYPCLNVLEVALRNSIHRAASNHFGTAMWMDDCPALVLRRSEADKVHTAKFSLAEKGKQITPDAVVAELPLGFWNALLNVYYERRLVHLIIRAVFPNMPRATRTRSVVSKRVNIIRGLRNRVFHHEPVWYWGNLADLHQDVTEACHWISVDFAKILARIDRFAPILTAGPGPFLKVL